MTEQTILACCRYHFTEAERLQIAEELAFTILTRDKALRDFVIANRSRNTITHGATDEWTRGIHLAKQGKWKGSRNRRSF